MRPVHRSMAIGVVTTNKNPGFQQQDAHVYLYVQL